MDKHALIEPLRDPEYLIQIISNTTSVPAHTVRERLEEEFRQAGTNISRAIQAAGIPPYVWSDQLVEFYQTTDAFLYASITWNRNRLKLAMRDWIHRKLSTLGDVPLRILMYGDGTGFDSFFFAQVGHDVTYLETSFFASNIAKQLFAEADLRIRIIEDLQESADEPFDVVICLDVLEHVPHPESMVADLARVLRDDGHLFVHAPFWYIHPCVPTHLKIHRSYSGTWRRLYGRAGLNPIDARLLWNPLVLKKGPRALAASDRGFSARLRIVIGGILLRAVRFFPWPLTWTAARLRATGDVAR